MVKRILILFVLSLFIFGLFGCGPKTTVDPKADIESVCREFESALNAKDIAKIQSLGYDTPTNQSWQLGVALITSVSFSNYNIVTSGDNAVVKFKLEGQAIGLLGDRDVTIKAKRLSGIWKLNLKDFFEPEEA